MKIVNLNQNTDEWMQWRSLGVGASDVAVLTGSNSFTTPLKMWEIKCGFRQSDPINAAMAHGIKNEDVARQWMNEHFHFNLKPVCIEDPEKDHFKASLDGYDFKSDTLVEIKCPLSKGIINRARMSHPIPDYWFDQVQWQIMLSNPKVAMIAVWDYQNSCCITIDVFKEIDKIEHMRKLADEFWHHIQIGKAPELSKSDYIDIKDVNLKPLLFEYNDLNEKFKEISNRKKEVKKQIEEFGDDGNFTAFGFRIQRISPPTSYDIEKMRTDGIDVDAYAKRNESIGYYRIYPPKNKVSLC